MPVTIDGTAGVISPNMTVTTLTPGSTVGVGTGGILNSSGGGSGTVSAGTAGQLATYAASGTTVSGFTLGTGWSSALGAALGTGVGTALSLGTNTAGGILVPSAAGTAGQVLLGAGSGTSPTWSATPTLGVVGTTAGTLALAGSTSGSTTLAASAVAGTTTATLPARTGNLMMDGPAFFAYATATQSLTDSTLTKLLYDTELYDTNSNFAASRFTVTIAGYYQITALTSFDSAGILRTSGAACGIYVNGASYTSGTYQIVPSGATSVGTTTVASGIVKLNVGDYVEIFGITNYGPSTVGTGQAAKYVCGCLIRGA